MTNRIIPRCYVVREPEPSGLYLCEVNNMGIIISGDPPRAIEFLTLAEAQAQARYLRRESHGQLNFRAYRRGVRPKDAK